MPLSDWGQKEGGPALSPEAVAPGGGRRPSCAHSSGALEGRASCAQGGLRTSASSPDSQAAATGDAPHAPRHGAQDLPLSFPPDPHARVPGAQVGSGVQGRSCLPHTLDPEAACTPVDHRRGLPRSFPGEGTFWSLSSPHEGAHTRPCPL